MYKLKVYSFHGHFDHEEYFSSLNEATDRYKELKKLCGIYHPVPTVWIFSGEWKRMAGF